MNFENDQINLKKEIWTLKSIKIILIFESNCKTKLEKEDRIISE